jgi:rod shape-determining protein MreD
MKVSTQKINWQRETIKWAVNLGSVLLCALLMFVRFPGMEMLGISPNWLLIWVVAWSVKRTPLEGAIAGLFLGLIQDALTNPDPSHGWGLVLTGVLTARIQKHKYVQEDIVSVALIVFGTVILNETVMAIQYSFWRDRILADTWLDHQRIALASAILTSLWAPAVYLPLNFWWQKQLKEDQQIS